MTRRFNGAYLARRPIPLGIPDRLKGAAWSMAFTRRMSMRERFRWRLPLTSERQRGKA